MITYLKQVKFTCMYKFFCIILLLTSLHGYGQNIGIANTSPPEKLQEHSGIMVQ